MMQLDFIWLVYVKLIPFKTLGVCMKNNNEENFENLGLSSAILKGVRDAGFTTPSPIQAQAIPVILQKKDVIAQAQTGTGKTAAFALPVIEMLKNNKSIEALVITPTRELAMQVSDEVFKLGKPKNVKTVCVYGGQSIKRQCELIEKKPQVMIATPGRLLDHLQNGRLDDFAPRFVILDESDEMLDMGFLPSIEEIFNYLPNNIQVLLFSATMPEAIKKLAQKILHNPVHIKITPTNVTNLDITQRFCVVNENERKEALIRLLDTQSIHKSIIFTRTKREADELYSALLNKGYRVGALHGDMEQRDRRSAILDFKNKKNEILVATDVASRGLDISDVSHVFNYHIPVNSEVYVHRIGRTGRAGKKGVAITLITPAEFKDMKKIQKDVGSMIELYEIPQNQFNPKAIINKILKARINDTALEIYQNLRSHLDTEEIILKLLALQTKSENIGLSQKDIEKLQREEEERENKKNTKKPQKNSRISPKNKRSNASGKQNNTRNSGRNRNSKKGRY